MAPGRTLHAAQGSSGARAWLGFALFTMVALSPACAYLFLGRDAPLPGRIQACGWSLALWAVWVGLWGSARRASIAALPFLLCVPVSWFLLVAYHTRINPAVLGIVAETTLEETAGYMRGLWIPAAVAYGVTFGLAAFALLLLRARDLRWQHASRSWVLGGIGAALVGLQSLYQIEEKAAAGLQAQPNPFRIEPLPGVLEELRATAPFGVLLSWVEYRDGEAKLRKAQQLLEHFRFHALQLPPVSGRQVVVLVIGESARRDRWALYGYPRPTTPRLQALRNVLALGDVLSAATSTRLSVPVILTRKPAARAAQISFEERSIVSAFREAGFATYWYSNQAPLGAFDSPIGLYAREAEHVAYFNQSGGTDVTPPDGVMLAALRSALGSRDERQFIVIHTLGSHFDYRYRYPPAFAKFRPVPSGDAELSMHDPAARDALNNAYDNSILYTDWFLSEVIRSVEASGRPVSTVLYVSDHGDDLYDQSCEHAGHGRATPTSYRVPALLWYSDEYQRRFPDRLERLRAHRDLPLTTEAIFPLLTDLGGIEIPGEDRSRSPASALFRPPVRRLVSSFSGIIDFDRARLNAQCELVN